jgi:hypothetical protein
MCKMTPNVKYGIKETAKVCACIALIIFAGTAIEKVAGAVLIPK